MDWKNKIERIPEMMLALIVVSASNDEEEDKSE